MSTIEKRNRRRAPRELYALIAANAPLWGGEAEICTTYFSSRSRSAALDAAWLARQCFKEMSDGLVGRLGQLTRSTSDCAEATSRAAKALDDEVVRVELAHYIAFAIAYRLSVKEAGVEAVSPHIGADWAENGQLQAMRARHRREHGELGDRAAAFTEGGYCTLYRVGMGLPRSSARNAAIADACARVYEDELDHMLSGIAGLSDASWRPEEWALLTELTVAQGRGRIRMRNAQFGHPVSETRVRELEHGAATPLVFDFERAGLLAPDHTR